MLMPHPQQTFVTVHVVLQHTRQLLAACAVARETV
jgi:hypothetical protein